MKKDIVCIGDPHGCVDELKELLDKVNYDPVGMRVVIVGDFVDRGISSSAVVRLSRELNLEGVKGNHDSKAERWRKHEKNSKLTGKTNPMKSMSQRDIDSLKDMSEDDWEYLEKLPVRLDLGHNWWAVHAGFEPGSSFDRQKPDQMMRVRYVNDFGKMVPLGPNLSQPEGSVYWADVWRGYQNVIFGHCVFEDVKVFSNENNTCIGIDTGCVFGGKLTAAIMKDNEHGGYDIEYVSVPAKKTYYSTNKFKTFG
jgi:bis(5'-nucleosyl)-tetraphosphatase (symmetrical)